VEKNDRGVRERVHQHIIGEAHKLDFATVIQSNGRISTESFRLDNSVIGEPAAFQQILNTNSPVGSGVIPDIPKVFILLEGHEPEIGAKNNGDHSVGDEDPVEYGQPNSNVILLDDGPHRYDKGSHIQYAKDETD